MSPLQKQILSNLVAYQPESVISREIVRASGGTVTAFAFDAGQGLSEHKAPFDALVEVFDGEARIIISGVDFDLKAGEVIVMPAGEPHVVKAVTPFKMLLTMIRS